MRRFDMQLNELNNMLQQMGELIVTTIALAAQALIEHDMELAQKVIDGEKEINQIEKDIEALCLKLLLQQQPVASDLRLISSALKMITDLERIGDQAADICDIVIVMGDEPHVVRLETIQEMATATVKMVTESIDAYVTKDLKLAKAVKKYDDVVDGLFDKAKNDLIEMIRSGTPNSEQAIDLLMIAKYFERIGDHARNVAEWVMFSIQGRKVKKAKAE